MMMTFSHLIFWLFVIIVLQIWSLASKLKNLKPKLLTFDAIKQNESEVGQIHFLFFWFIVYNIICKAIFYNRPLELVNGLQR